MLAALGRAAALAGPTAAPPSLDLPTLTPQQGAALVELARGAMGRYLARRISPGDVPIPKELWPLRTKHHAAAVTLRTGGTVAAVSVQRDADLCTNVVAAALAAMRSPKLPDRVDPNVLAALTVEVEVLSDLRPVEQERLAEQVIPGLTGLAYWQGDGPPGWVLPSAAYVLDMDADQMRRSAMAAFRLTPRNASLGAQLAMFFARHYVGLPGQPAVERFRGKDLVADDSIDGPALEAAARQVGRFLVRHQDRVGRYGLPQGDPSMVDHLFAAWAMGQLAARAGPGRDHEDFARSAATAVDYAAAAVRRTAGRTLVEAGTDRRKDSFLATALLVLSLAHAPPGAQWRQLRGELVAGLKGEFADVDFAAAATQPAAGLRELYIAYLALATANDPAAGDARTIGELRQRLAALRPASAESNLWRHRAGLASKALAGAADDPDREFALTQSDGQPLSDERGGLMLANQPPTTVVTGLMAVCLTEALARSPRPLGAEMDEMERVRRQRDEARRFCLRMIYRPREAYFAARPEDWAGGVRASAGSAKVTLPACAMALNALLAR